MHLMIGKGGGAEDAWYWDMNFQIMFVPSALMDR